MATWVTHLMVADEVIKKIPSLCKHEFFVGNIAPDCNVENEDWISFIPSREVTHWMGNERKTAADCDRFLHEGHCVQGRVIGHLLINGRKYTSMMENLFYR